MCFELKQNSGFDKT